MRIIGLFMIMICVFGLTGCITTSQHEKERVDQGVTGNRGYIFGGSASSVSTTKPTTRTVYEVEIELPALPRLGKQSVKEVKEITGNRGYIKGGEFLSVKKQEIIPETKNIPSAKIKESLLAIKESQRQITENKAKTYKVKKRDTLWNIAGYPEVYGNNLKWQRLYEANRDKIKNPNRIYPGQVLFIPED